MIVRACCLMTEQLVRCQMICADHYRSCDCFCPSPFPLAVYTEVGSIAVATIEMPGSNFGLSNEANMDYVDPYSSHVSMFHRASAFTCTFSNTAAPPSTSWLP